MKLLILGAGGYLGGVLHARALARADVTAVGTTRQQADVLHAAAVTTFLREAAPDAVVWCLADFEKETTLSAEGLANVLQALPSQTRFVYVSTMLAQGANQTEDTPPVPRADGAYLADYVNGKIAGEALVRTRPNHVILRSGQVYGLDAQGAPDKRMQRIAAQCAAGQFLPRAADAFVSTVHVEDLADSILELCHNDFKGTLCVAAPPVSYYHFYRQLAVLTGLPAEIITPQAPSDAPNDYFNTRVCHQILQTKLRGISANEDKKGGCYIE